MVAVKVLATAQMALLYALAGVSSATPQSGGAQTYC